MSFLWFYEPRKASILETAFSIIVAKQVSGRMHVSNLDIPR